MRDLIQVIKNTPLDALPHLPGRPYILVDSLRPKVQRALIGVAIGRAAHKALNLNVGYLCYQKGKRPVVDEIYEKSGFRPFQIAQHISEQSIYFNIYARAGALMRCLKHKNPESLLGMKIQGIPMGDLIYDSVLKWNDNIYTLKHANTKNVYGVILDTLVKLNAISKIFDSNKIEYMALSHKVYTTWGIPARLATNKGVTVLSFSRPHIRRINTMEDHIDYDFNVSHEEISKIANKLSKKDVRFYIKDRFDGRSEGKDVMYAFSNKKDVPPREVADTLNLSTDRPVGLIAPHVFTDAPHCHQEMIHNDYYQWFVRILDITSKINSVQWIVKPHPSSPSYNEEGVADEIIEKYDHVKKVPDDLKTDTVLSVSDAVLTVRGTIGMEALLFDCQVILSGNAFYDDLPSVQTCLSEQILEKKLRSIKMKEEHHIPKKEKEQAAALLYYREKTYNYTSPMIGRAQSTESDFAEQNITEWSRFVADTGYQEDLFFREIVKFMKGEDEKVSFLNVYAANKN